MLDPWKISGKPSFVPNDWSSETQGQSVGSREKERRKFSSTGGKAPGYGLSPDHCRTVKRMLAPDWAQKCFVLLCPIGEQHLLSSFRVFVRDGYCLAILVRFVHQSSLDLVHRIGNLFQVKDILPLLYWIILMVFCKQELIREERCRQLCLSFFWSFLLSLVIYRCIRSKRWKCDGCSLFL